MGVRDTALRPVAWDEYIGQPRAKDRLKVAVTSSLIEERPLPHVLLTGELGSGKSSLAAVVAAAVRDPLLSITFPIGPPALLSALKGFAAGDGGVLCLEAIHSATRAQQEDLLTLLDEGYVSVPSGRRVVFGWLTVIAATTEPQCINPTLVERFGIVLDFERYSNDELTDIVRGLGRKAGIELASTMAAALGRAAGGSPRTARNLVLAFRDLAHSEEPTVERALVLCQVEADGLTAGHLAYLRALSDLGGTASARALSDRLRMDESTVLQLERLLVDLDLVDMTGTGHDMMTPAAHARLDGSTVPVLRPRG